MKRLEYSNLKLQKNEIEATLKLLEPQNKSVDMLEEKIKEQFSFAKEKELLIVIQDPYKEEDDALQ